MLNGYPQAGVANLEKQPEIVYFRGTATAENRLPGAPSDAGSYTAQATWGRATASVAFTIDPAVFTGVSLDHSKAKKVYAEGDALDVSGLALTENYSDGSGRQINVTEGMVSGFDGKKPGKQTLTVTCAEFTATYEIEVQAKTNNPNNGEEEIIIPKTGDESNLALWFAMVIVCLIAMVLLLPISAKRNRRGAADKQ